MWTEDLIHSPRSSGERCKAENCYSQAQWSLPLSMQHKTGPEVGRRPAFLSGHFKLSCPQSRPCRHAVFEHTLIKKLHQFRRRQIVDIPQTRDHTRRAGVHKSARQPDQSLALDLFAQPRLARAEHDQIGVELEVVDLMEP